MTGRTSATFLASRGGQVTVVIVALILFIALTFRVNAVKSEVNLLERQIVQIERERLLLETEYETRASQRQLSSWNEVEFGYLAPTGEQFVDHDWQLASYGSPAPQGAPQPIRLARNEGLPASEGALADLARVLDSEPVDRGREELGRAMAMLGGDDAPEANDDAAPFNVDTDRLARRLTRGTEVSSSLNARLVRAGQ
jgi:hypothetical protein